MSKSRSHPLLAEKNKKQLDKLDTINPAGRPVEQSPLISLFEKSFLPLSLASFVIVLFFAVTGLTLNHPNWFADQAKTTRQKGIMPTKWVNNPDTTKIAKLEIVEFLRNKYGVKGQVSDFAIDDSECSITFKGPGYASDAFIIRETGEYDLSETRMGLVAVMNDLHKGNGTGNKRMIDLSAIFLIVMSIAGLILPFIKRKL